MPNNEMDYSLIHRTPDGTGKILVTTPGSPDKGSWETEAELKTYVNQDVNAAINAVNTRVTNIEETLMGENEITVQYPDDGNYSSLMPNKVPLRALKYAEVPRFRGKSRAWNQLAKALNSTNWYEEFGAVVSYSDGVATITPTAKYSRIACDIPYTANHIMLLMGRIKLSNSSDPTSVGLAIYGVDTVVSGTGDCQATTNWQNISVMLKSTSAIPGARVLVRDHRDSDWGTIQATDIVCYDLTLIFGAGNEPATVADAIAQLPALGQYNAYDAGSLVDTTVTGVEARGKNLAQINNFTQSVSYGTEVPCVLKGGLTYTASGTVSGGSTLRLLKSDGTYQYISLTENFDETFVAEADITEATFYGAVTVSNFQVELGSSKTSFAPWVNPDTLSLSTPVTLRSAGSVADELDVESGVVTRKMGVVDLSTLSWGESGGIYYAALAGMASDAEGVCSNYVVTHKNAPDLADGEMNCGFNAGYLQIKTSSSPTGTLVYELATPTTESIDPVPYNFLEVEGGGTVETIQTQTPVIDNCLDVTYDIIPQ